MSPFRFIMKILRFIMKMFREVFTSTKTKASTPTTGLLRQRRAPHRPLYSLTSRRVSQQKHPSRSVWIIRFRYGTDVSRLPRAFAWRSSRNPNFQPSFAESAFQSIHSLSLWEIVSYPVQNGSFRAVCNNACSRVEARTSLTKGTVELQFYGNLIKPKVAAPDYFFRVLVSALSEDSTRCAAETRKNRRDIGRGLGFEADRAQL